MTYLHAPDIREVAQVSFATVDSKGVMRALPEDLTFDDLRDFGYLSCKFKIDYNEIGNSFRGERDLLVSVKGPILVEVTRPRSGHRRKVIQSLRSCNHVPASLAD